jgi:hypothetical protein
MDLTNFIGQTFKWGAVAEAGLTAYNQSGNDPNNSAGAKYFMGNFVYPSDLVNADIGRNAYISIKFKSYERRSIFAAPFLRARGGITLPLPGSLNDATSVNWNASQADAKSAAVGAGIEQLIAPSKTNEFGGSGAASRNFAESALNSLKNSGADGSLTGALAAGAGAYGAATISGALGGAGAQALQLAGLAANPFMTMLFQSPNFKSHSFSWVFAPRNPQESAMIAAIIQSFKFNMLPGLSGGGSAGTFFSYPNIADIQLYPTNAYLYKFKPCAVKSVTADYAPNGPSFFKDTFAPTHISLGVEFQEIEMWTKESMTDGGGAGNYKSALFDAAAGLAGKAFDSIKDTNNTIKQDNQNYPNVYADPGSNPQ